MCTCVRLFVIHIDMFVFTNVNVHISMYAKRVFVLRATYVCMYVCVTFPLPPTLALSLQLKLDYETTIEVIQNSFAYASGPGKHYLEPQRATSVEPERARSKCLCAREELRSTIMKRDLFKECQEALLSVIKLVLL